MVKILLGLLVILAIYFSFVFFTDYSKTKKKGELEKSNFLTLGFIGFIANFFDTLGIGSFAPTTAVLKNFKLSKDRTLPGTLNVACTLPIVTEALIFITVIKVDTITLVSMITSATLGAFLGAGVVSKLDEKKIQVGMGIALILVAGIMAAQELGIMPTGGESLGLSGIKLAIAVAANFVLGALMTLGIGLYAPCMALVFALGMNPKAAFPIMMASCAFLMPVASAKFVREGAYDRKASMAIALFGIVGVIIAAYIVKELPIELLKRLIIIVVLYTSVMMFRSARKVRKNK